MSMMFHHLMQTLPARIDITPKIRLLIFQRPHLCLVRIQHKNSPDRHCIQEYFHVPCLRNRYRFRCLRSFFFRTSPVNGLAI